MDIKAVLFESGFEAFDDFLSENFGIEEVFGFFEAFVSAIEDVAAGFIAIDATNSCL